MHKRSREEILERSRELERMVRIAMSLVNIHQCTCQYGESLDLDRHEDRCNILVSLRWLGVADKWGLTKPSAPGRMLDRIRDKARVTSYHVPTTLEELEADPFNLGQ